MRTVSFSKEAVILPSGRYPVFPTRWLNERVLTTALAVAGATAGQGCWRHDARVNAPIDGES